MQRPERRAAERGPSCAGFFEAACASQYEQHAAEQGGIDEMHDDVRAQKRCRGCGPVAGVDKERERGERRADRIAEPRREVVDHCMQVVDAAESTERGKVYVVVE